MGAFSVNRLKKKQRLSDAGFTLVELIIASGVVGVGMAMAIGSLISVSTAQRTTEANAVATTLNISVLEEVRNTTSINHVYAFVPPDIRSLGLGASAVVTVTLVDTANNEHALPLTGGVPIMPNPVEVRSLIQWMDQEGRVRQQQASTFYRRI